MLPSLRDMSFSWNYLTKRPRSNNVYRACLCDYFFLHLQYKNPFKIFGVKFNFIFLKFSNPFHEKSNVVRMNIVQLQQIEVWFCEVLQSVGFAKDNIFLVSFI